jgi:hypothetical protein
MNTPATIKNLDATSRSPFTPGAWIENGSGALRARCYSIAGTLALAESAEPCKKWQM